MNKENETISDIVAEMKNLVKSNGTKSRTNIPTLTIRAWLSLANRIEAAYKREVADLTRECERLKEERNRALDLPRERRSRSGFTRLRKRTNASAPR